MTARCRGGAHIRQRRKQWRIAGLIMVTALDTPVTQNFNTLLNTVNSTVLDRVHRRDFSAVFERYIHA